MDPKARVLLLTPINAHDLNSKSIVFGAEDVVEIKMGSRRFQKDETACVSFDGDTPEHLHVETVCGLHRHKVPSGSAKSVTRVSWKY